MDGTGLLEAPGSGAVRIALLSGGGRMPAQMQLFWVSCGLPRSRLPERAEGNPQKRRAAVSIAFVRCFVIIDLVLLVEPAAVVSAQKTLPPPRIALPCSVLV